MRHSSDAKIITKNLYCLGPSFVPAYLLDGLEPVMFDAGMSFAGEHYAAELKKILKDRPLHYLFISHMHFDHCGAAGYLKEIYPDLKICAAQAGAEIILKPSAIKLIEQLSIFPGLKEEQKFKPFTVDLILEDGQQFLLADGSQVQILACPGHTRDLLAFYLNQYHTLLPSEAAGVPMSNGRIYSEFLVDCEQYFLSLQKLAKLKADRILFAHNFFFDSEDARQFFANALSQGMMFKNRLVGLLDDFGGDTEKIVQIVKKEEYDASSDPKQPEAAYLINLRAKIKAVLKTQVLLQTETVESAPS